MLGTWAAARATHQPRVHLGRVPCSGSPSPPPGDRVSTSTSTTLWNASDPKTGESRGLYWDHAVDGGLCHRLVFPEGAADPMDQHSGCTLGIVSLLCVQVFSLSCIFNYFKKCTEFGLKTNHQMDPNTNLQPRSSWRPGATCLNPFSVLTVS